MGEEVAHAGSKLQTLFFGDDLDRKLGGLRNAARVLEKDAGFSALYCAFGFLEYYESEQSEEKRVAPLVFVPVALDRVLAEQRYSYTLKSRNEDVEINVAVAELLKDLAVKLPAWEEDENDEFPLGTYLKRVEMAISGKHDWRVRRYVTVGLFTFSTLAMYKDLDPQRWPDGAPIEGRPVLRDLIAGVETSDIKYAEDYEIESLQGPEPLLITDADSSQHSAVVDVLRNNASQVIQGPPGTGKSQTITNIIAAALNEGLSVLFVAEKMAALEVVKKRLDSAGLEVFCLELHSSKTSKTAVTESLGKRMEYRAPLLKSHVVQSNADALSAARADLLRYVERVNHPAGTTGLKVCDVLSRERHQRWIQRCFAGRHCRCSPWEPVGGFPSRVPTDACCRGDPGEANAAAGNVRNPRGSSLARGAEHRNYRIGRKPAHYPPFRMERCHSKHP